MAAECGDRQKEHGAGVDASPVSLSALLKILLPIFFINSQSALSQSYSTSGILA